MGGECDLDKKLFSPFPNQMFIIFEIIEFRGI